MASRFVKETQHAVTGQVEAETTAPSGETGSGAEETPEELAGYLMRHPPMTSLQPEPASQPDPEAGPHLSVWPTAQRDARTQRRGRYLPESTAHPAKMLPAIAATAIARYTRPGDLVADPMCGIGTTLVEAVHLGRDGLGIEYEPRWAQVAAANVSHARRNGATGTAEVICGDARRLPSLIPPGAAGRAALVITSPPYGSSVHGQVTAEQRRGAEGGVRKYDNRYGRDPANLASRGLDELLDGFTQILAGCRALLRPGGLAVITTRPWREHGELVDLPAAVLAAAARAGLVPVARSVALLAGLRDGRLIARPSFFQLHNLREARGRGEPWHLIVHEDVIIVRNPPFPGSSAAAGLEPANGAQQRAWPVPGQGGELAA
jgi:SAM-dependent methyltransferase